MMQSDLILVVSLQTIQYCTLKLGKPGKGEHAPFVIKTPRTSGVL